MSEETEEPKTAYVSVPEKPPYVASVEEIRLRWEGEERSFEEWTGMGTEWEPEGRAEFAQRDVLFLLEQLELMRADNVRLTKMCDSSDNEASLNHVIDVLRAQVTRLEKQVANGR